MTTWKLGFVNSKSYLPLLDIKDPQRGALCSKLFDDKSFWNIDLNVKLRGSRESISQCFSLLIQTSLSEGRKRSRKKEKETHVGEHLCVCVCDSCEMCTHLNKKRLCVCATVCIPVCASFWVRWETAWFLNRRKQVRALLTMPLRVNAQNNFQLKIRFSGKSEFHAYYCRINADPHSTSVWWWNLWQ